MRRFLLFFFLFNLVLSSFYLDVWHNANTTSRGLPVVTFFEAGTFRIDKYHALTVDKAYVNGHYYTDKAPLPTYVVIPFFGLCKWAGLIPADETGSLFGNGIYLLGGFLTASLPFAVLLLFVFNEIRRNRPKLSPVLLATLPFYGSFLFVFTGTYFAHIFSAVLLLAAYLLIKRGAFFAAGLVGGLSFLSEYNLAVVLFMWGIMILANEKRLKPALYYVLGILPALAFILYYNSMYSSSAFTFMYKHHNFTELDSNYGFVIPGAESFWGLSFGTYRGIFFYAPFLITGLLVVFSILRKGQGLKLLSSYLFLPFAVYFVFIASYFAWWGGWTYGPRLLLAMVLILLYRLVVYYSEHGLNHFVFMGLSILGLLVILPAKGTIAYSAPTGIQNPLLELVVEGLRQGNYNPNNILSLWVGVPSSLSFFFFLVLFTFGLIFMDRWYRKCCST